LAKQFGYVDMHHTTENTHIVAVSRRMVLDPGRRPPTAPCVMTADGISYARSTSPCFQRHALKDEGKYDRSQVVVSPGSILNPQNTSGLMTLLRPHRLTAVGMNEPHSDKRMPHTESDSVQLAASPSDSVTPSANPPI
jgi:hypothetical protein